MSLAYERVQSHVDRLKLKRVAELIDPIAEQASKGQALVPRFPRPLAGSRSGGSSAAPDAGQDPPRPLPFLKTLADFDFHFQWSIDRKQIQELATLRFLAHGENVIFLGPPGVGKTHLAVALGAEAVAQGANVYFITIPDLHDQLARDVQENRVAEHLRSLRHPTLLILDEMGYLPLDHLAASFLFQLVSKRYTKGSIIITSNSSPMPSGARCLATSSPRRP